MYASQVSEGRVRALDLLGVFGLGGNGWVCDESGREGQLYGGCEEADVRLRGDRDGGAGREQRVEEVVTLSICWVLAEASPATSHVHCCASR
jgi:hypothetical protein